MSRFRVLLIPRGCWDIARVLRDGNWISFGLILKLAFVPHSSHLLVFVRFYSTTFVSHRHDLTYGLIFHTFTTSKYFQQPDNHARRRTQPTQAETFQSSSHAEEAQGQGQEEEQQARGRSSFCLVNCGARYGSRADWSWEIYEVILNHKCLLLYALELRPRKIEIHPCRCEIDEMRH